MYEKAPLNIITIVNATGDGEGSYVETAPGQLPGDSKARLFLNVTALAGSGTPVMDVKVVVEVAGIDQDVASFAQSVENGGADTIVVDACPSRIKVVYEEGGTVTDFDATVDIIRF